MIFGFYQSRHDIGHGLNTRVYDFLKIRHYFGVSDTRRASVL